MHRWLPVLLLLASCSPKTATPPAPAAADDTPTADTPTADTPTADAPTGDGPVLNLPPPAHDTHTVVQMHAWLQSAETARTHLTRGDLQAARESAASMAASPSPDGIPAGWRPFAADLLAEASALAASGTVEVAGGHLGNMALACGTCHTEAGVIDQVAAVVLPPEMWDEDMRMENHQWASDWMWFGLVTENPQAYRLGAATFASPDLPAPPQSVSGTGLMPLMANLRVVAARAAESQGDEERAAHYGQLIATCAACHAMPMVE